LEERAPHRLPAPGEQGFHDCRVPLDIDDGWVDDQIDVDGPDVDEFRLEGIVLEGALLECAGLAEGFEDEIRRPAADEHQGIAVSPERGHQFGKADA